MWFVIAERTGRTVAEAQATISHREFIAWREWIETEHERPSRSDWYLMQIAREVACVLASKENRAKVKLKDFRLQFTTEANDRTKPKLDSKTAWLALLGFDKDGRRNRDREASRDVRGGPKAAPGLRSARRKRH